MENNIKSCNIAGIEQDFISFLQGKTRFTTAEIARLFFFAKSGKPSFYKAHKALWVLESQGQIKKLREKGKRWGGVYITARSFRKQKK